jgi:hypothetical protein
MFYTALFAPLEGGEVVYQKKCTESQCSLYKLSVGYERVTGKKVLNSELVKTVNRTKLNPNPPLVCKNSGGKEKMKDRQDLCIFQPGEGHVNFGGIIRKKYE